MEKLGMELHLDSSKQRINTGIDGLDELLQGGFPKGSITMLSGTPGTGKTIVCFQYIDAGLKQGEKCLFLTSDERIHTLLHQATEMGFDFQTPVKNGQLKFMYLDPERHSIHHEMEEEIHVGKYARVVLDSITPLSEIPVWMVNRGTEIIPSEDVSVNTPYPLDSVQAMRVHLRRLISILAADNCTTLLTSEVPEGSRDLSRDSISEFLVDGILIMDLDPTMDRRKLTIRKMRGTKHTLKPHDIEINSKGGIRLFL